MSQLASFPTFPSFTGLSQPEEDPYARERQRIAGGTGSGGTAPPQPPTPQEEGLLPRVMGAAQYVGETLDKPGSAVRGLLGGDPSQLANLIPFSDTLGLTNAMPGSKSVFGTEPLTLQGSKQYGSDLLTKAGVPTAPEEWSWENAPAKIGRGLAGFGVDVATDPLTWLTGPLGMLSRGAKEARTAAEGLDLAHMDQVTAALNAVPKEAGPAGLGAVTGTLGTVFSGTPIGYANEIRDGTRSLFGLGLPWSKEPWMEFNLMPKEWAANVVEKGFYGAYSPVNWFRGILSPSVAKEAMTFAPMQQMRNDLLYVARQYYGSAANNIAVALKNAETAVNSEWQNISQHFTGQGAVQNADDFSRLMGETFSKHPTAAGFTQELQGILGSGVGDPAQVAAVAQRVHEAVKGVIDVKDQLHDILNSYGIPTKELRDDYIEHLTRSSTAGATKAAMRRKMGLAAYEDARANPNMPRDEIYKDLPQGSLTGNSIARDELLYDRRWQPADPAVLDELEAALKSGDRPAIDKIQAGIASGEIPQTLAAMDNDAAKESLREQLREAVRNQPGANAASSGVWFDPTKIDSMSKAELQAAYVNEYHIRPAHEIEWPAAGGLPNSETRFRPGIDGGAPRELTAASEQARWTQGDDTGAIVKALRSLQKATGDGIIHNGIFDRSVVQDQVRYNHWAMQNLASVMSAHTFLGKEGIVGKASEGFVGRELGKTWRDAGFFKGGLTKFVEQNYGDEFASGLNKELGLAADADEAARQGAIQAQAAATPYVGTEAEAMRQIEGAARDKVAGEMTDDLRVHPDAEGAVKAYRLAMRPQSTNPILKGLDAMKGTYQRMLYNVFPQTMVRDFLSHAFNHWSAGDASLADIVAGYNNARQFAKAGGQDVGGPFIRELISMGGLRGTDMQDILQKSLDENASLPFGGFLKNAWSGPNVAKSGAELGVTSRAADPGWLGKIASGMGEATGVPVTDRVMTRARNWQNFVQRAGYYDALRRGGFDPAAAMDKMLSASFNYGEQSKFGKEVMNRAYLFWGFRSKNMPYQLANIAAQPGGRTAQTMRLLSEVANNNTPGVYTPSFLRERENIPIGQTNPQAQSFFSTTALPFSDLNDVVLGGGAGHDLQRTGEKLASGLAPWFLAPLELSGDRQFSTGRKLEDLENVSGSRTLDTAIHYSPLSRMESEYEAFRHPGKTAGQLALSKSGLGSVATYDAEKWKLNDLRDLYAQMLAEGQRPWTNYFLPKSEAAGMPAAAVQAAEADRKRNEGLNQLMRALAAKKKATEAAAQAQQMQGATP